MDHQRFRNEHYADPLTIEIAALRNICYCLMSSIVCRTLIGKLYLVAFMGENEKRL